MNYMTEILAFMDLVQVKSLSTGQIALWYALMYVNNKCAWAEWFTVPNITLELHTGLSRQGIDKCRNILKQYGVVDFKSNGTKATSYKIFSLEKQSKNQATMQDSLQAGSQVGLQVGLQDGLQVGLQVGCQNSGTLNKRKEMKLKEKNKTPLIPLVAKEPKQKFGDDVTLTAAEYAKLVDEFGEVDTLKMIEILDNYKGSSGKTYKSDYKAILNWVVKRLAEEKGKESFFAQPAKPIQPAKGGFMGILAELAAEEELKKRTVELTNDQG